MAKAPAAWHADPTTPFAKADVPLRDTDWTVSDTGRGPSLLSTAGRPAAVTAQAVLMQPPSRWNEDPKQPLSCTLTSDSLISWIRSMEAWVLPHLKGTDARSPIKTNAFEETYVRAKLGPETRYFSADGVLLPGPPTLAPNTPCTVLLSVKPYQMNGAVGLSLRVLAIQA
jgi:hypothetical protein